uniref:Uncharacterized protein n=1 Tax=Daphnia magna TaxID=35525 RepID=A0A0P5WTM2_9CRUS
MFTYISTCLVVMAITKLKLSFPENRISSRLQWKCRNMISANHPVARPNENENNDAVPSPIQSLHCKKNVMNSEDFCARKK